MHRPGHLGAALLASLPVAVVLSRFGTPVLAVLSLGAVPVLTPLPDWDQRVNWLTHRGVTHTPVFAVAVGAVFGGLGWGLASVPGTALAGPAIDPGLFAGDLASALDALPHPAYRRWTRPVLASAGFVVGTGATAAHLLSDVVTPSGIPLWWPATDRRVSLDIVAADNRWANYALLVAGIGSAWQCLRWLIG